MKYVEVPSTGEKLQKNYCFLDLCKFIGALLVVTIHVPPLTSYSALLNYGVVNYLARLAVPFFFLSSGYFLFRKTSYDAFCPNIAFTYARRIFRLYLIWTVIYSPLILKNIFSGDNELYQGILYWIRDFLFVGSYSQLWYLNATVVAALILTLCVSKKIEPQRIFLLALLLYLIGLLPQTYFGLLRPLSGIPPLWSLLKMVQQVIVTTRNGLFEGFLFMTIGMLLANRNIVLKLSTVAVGFLASMLLLGCEVLLLRHLGWIRQWDMYLFLIPAVFFLFYGAIHLEVRERPLYLHLRKLSALFFYSHTFFDAFLCEMLAAWGWDNSILHYLCVVTVTFIFSEAVILASGHRSFGWLKKLYS